MSDLTGLLGGVVSAVSNCGELGGPMIRADVFEELLSHPQSAVFSLLQLGEEVVDRSVQLGKSLFLLEQALSREDDGFGAFEIGNHTGV
jgi:hypothetical protein